MCCNWTRLQNSIQNSLDHISYQHFGQENFPSCCLFPYLDIHCYIIDFIWNYILFYCFPGASEGKVSACNAGDLSLIPGLGTSLEKEMATHSSTLAWKIPYQLPQSHIWQCKKHQFCKTGEIQITQPEILVKSQERIKIGVSTRCSTEYPRSSDLLYSVQIFIFQGNYILALSIRYIAQFSSVMRLIILSRI